jgi:AraC-like DNA-binding protein
MRNSAVHVVRDGACWLRLAGRDAPIPLSQGDVVLVASGIGHALSDPPDAPVSAIRDALAAGLGGTDPPAGDGVTTLLCAKYLLEGAGPHPMVALLPPLIHLTCGQVEANEPLRLTLELLRLEAAGRSGSDMVVPRLLDSVLVFLLRAWIENQPPGTAGWSGALRDRKVALALRLIHERPADPWTVATLADRVSQSRATFARRFAGLVGEPPLSYLTRWRMNLAARALRDSDGGIDEVARAVGYESGPAFSKAFSRLTGQSPTLYRRGRT